MLESILSILFVYLFILLGLIAKKIFKEQMDSKTLTIFSVYFLQPFVAMWGFSTAKLSIEHGYVVLYYFGIIFYTSNSYPIYSKRGYLIDPKKRGAIFLYCWICGEIPGNHWYPFWELALFGRVSGYYIRSSLFNFLANWFFGGKIFRGS